MGGGRLRGVLALSGSTVLSFFLLLTLMLWAVWLLQLNLLNRLTRINGNRCFQQFIH